MTNTLKTNGSRTRVPPRGPPENGKLDGEVIRQLNATISVDKKSAQLAQTSVSKTPFSLTRTFQSVRVALRNLSRFGLARASRVSFEQRVFGAANQNRAEAFANELSSLKRKVWGYGSAFTGRAFFSGHPFDARGSGSSDVDLILAPLPTEKNLLTEGMKSPTYSTERPFPDTEVEEIRKRLCQLAGREVTLQIMSGPYRLLLRLLTLQPFTRVGSG